MPAPSYVYDLLASETLVRWGANSPVGSAVTITYSFPSIEPSSINYPNFTPMTAIEISAVRQALTYISSFTDITFVETAGAGQLEFGNADLTGRGSGVAGVANYSYTSAGIQHATIMISNTGPASLADSDFVPGSISSNDIGGQGWSTLLHEIGHALGLKHSFEANIDGDPGSILPSAVDDLAHTIMSYTSYQPSNVAIVTGTQQSYSYTYSSLSPSTYSLFDIAALQYLYGADTSSAGNKVFEFLPTVPVLETIYDAGPNNTIDCSALTGDCVIDLTPGATSTLAIAQSLPFGITLPNQYDGSSALTIAYGCFIANCIGGSGNDTIIGNSINNLIRGGNGRDYIAAGAGDDTVYGGDKGDFLFGNKGNDLIAPGAGADQVDGGLGLDRVWYGDSAGGVSVDLTTGTGARSDAAGDTYVNIERVTGSAFSDSIVGNALGNALKGGAGDDIIYGKDGRDVIEGQAGNDKLYGGAGNDNILGGAGNDKLFGNSGLDKLYGGAGNDQLTGGADADYFVFETQGTTGFGGDIVLDFQNGLDKLDMRGVYLTSDPGHTPIDFADLTIGAWNDGVKIVVQNSQIVYLDHAATGITVADIDAGDFLFA